VKKWLIRPAVEADSEQIVRGIKHYRSEINPEGQRGSPSEISSFVTRLFRTEGIRTFVAVQGDEVLGFLLFTYSATAYHLRFSLQLVDLWVAPQWRMNGVASSLMLAAIDHAKDVKDVKAGSLYFVMDPSKQRLMSFYERLGFQLAELAYLRMVIAPDEKEIIPSPKSNNSFNPTAG